MKDVSYFVCLFFLLKTRRFSCALCSERLFHCVPNKLVTVIYLD